MDGRAAAPGTVPQRPAAPALSIVSPVHNEGASLPAFVTAVHAALADLHLDYEVVLVDDGSRDDTWERIRAAAAADPRVRGLSFSRNFGKEAAMRAGLEEACGLAVVVIDADLQHPPDVIPAMVAAWCEGAEVVEAYKRNRPDQRLASRSASRLFNWGFSRLTDVELADATDFRLLTRPAVEALLAMPERSSFFRGTSTWIGFRRARVGFEVAPRDAGQTRWSVRSLARMAIDAITAFTPAPLRLVTVAGIVFALFAVVLGVQTIWQWAAGDAIQGFTTVILILLVQGTFVLVGLGIIGEYLARVHDEVKGRPRFIVARRTDDPA
jgi:polyisoprenyl-phosphate glycosyltransferase